MSGAVEKFAPLPIGHGARCAHVSLRSPIFRFRAPGRSTPYVDGGYSATSGSSTTVCHVVRFMPSGPHSIFFAAASRSIPVRRSTISPR